MSQQHKDILTVIKRHGSISTSEICEKLSELGYGGAMAWQDFRNLVSKQLCYLRDKGDIAGEDRPQAKGKPLRYWALAHPQSDCQSAGHSEHDLEMVDAEAVTEKCSATVQENLTVAETPEPVSVEVKVAHKPNLALADIMDAYHQEVAEDTDQNFYSFCLGVAYAEKHHGISQ